MNASYVAESLIVIATFLAIMRYVVLWYFRIDRAVDALETQAAALADIAESLRCIPAVQAYDRTHKRAPLRAA